MTSPTVVARAHSRKRMALAESVLDNLKEVVFQTNREGNWVFLNQAWQALTGLAPADSLGKHFIDYIYPDDRERCLSLFQPLNGGSLSEYRHEMCYLHRDGSARWVEAYARPALDEDGHLAANVFTNAGEGIIITSSEGLIVDVNSAFEAITAYTRAEVLGRNPNLLSSGRQGPAFYADM